MGIPRNILTGIGNRDRDAMATVAHDTDLLAAVFAGESGKEPEILRKKLDSYAHSKCEATLVWIAATAPELVEPVSSWAASIRRIKWTDQDGPIEKAHLDRFSSLDSLEVESVSLEGWSPPPMHQLKRLSVERGKVPADLCAWAQALPNLEHLRLYAVPLESIRHASKFERLRGLSVTQSPLQSISDLPPIEGLNVEGCPVEFLLSLALPSTLLQLDLSHTKVSDLGPLRACPHLKRVRLCRCKELQHLAPWQPSEGVEVDVDGSGLVDLHGLPTSARDYLSIDLPQLQTLEGLAHNIRSLTLRYCYQLDSLAHLPSQLEELDIMGCPRILTLAGIERCQRLRSISFYQCALQDLSPLAALPALVVVNAQYNDSIEALGELVSRPNVRAITLHGTGIARRDVPKELRWKCSWELGARGDEMAANNAPSTDIVLPTDKKKRVAALRKLLTASDQQTIDQGLELAAGLGDTEVYTALLQGVQWKYSRRNHAAGSGYAMVGGGFSGPLGQYAILGLIATGPSDHPTIAQLREQITELKLIALRTHEGKAPVNPVHLAALPNLSQLVLSHLGPILDGQSPAWPALEKLELHELSHLDHIRWIANAPRLSTLSLWYTDAKLDGLPPELQELSLFGSQVTVGPAGLPQLRSVSIGYRSNFTPIEAVAYLETLGKLSARQQLLDEVRKLREARGLPPVQEERQS